MAEEGKWMVHPRSGLAHYVLWLDSQIFNIRTRCNCCEVDNSWTPIEEPKRKCKNCEESREMDNAHYITLEEKLKALKDLHMKGAKNGN